MIVGSLSDSRPGAFHVICRLDASDGGVRRTSGLVHHGRCAELCLDLSWGWVALLAGVYLVRRPLEGLVL
jgi:hypothetical protein